MAPNPEELESEISRLWAKVATASPLQVGSDPSLDATRGQTLPAGSNDIAWETVAMLKRQHAGQSRTWTEILEAKERALQVFKDRQSVMERELSLLRAKAQTSDERVLGEVMDVQARMNEGVKALEEERARFEAEQATLRALLDDVRAGAGADSARWKTEEARWQKKEQQYLLDLSELQALSARYQEERGRAEGQTGRLGESLKEAKNALEKTLAELLRERRVREDSEAERVKALQKVDEVQKHFEELSRIWEEERMQWRQLWDRERSTWETQRGEFAAWEESLRREREAWHAEMETKERGQVRFAEEMSRSLRDSGQATSEIAGVMKRLANLEDGGTTTSLGRGLRKALRPALAVLLLASAIYPGWRLLAGWTMAPLSTQTVPLENPTGLANDGSLVWLSQWDGRLTAYGAGDTRTIVKSVLPKAQGPYHPIALAAGGGFLWSLDSAQARILRHDAGDPAKILHARPSPGPAPTALAFDGQSLWSYDAVNKSLYRHGDDEGTFKAVSFDQGVVPTAMLWVGARLWMFDTKARVLRVYEWKNETLSPLTTLVLGESVIGLAGAEGSAEAQGQLLLLAGPKSDRQGNSLMRYRYGRRLSSVLP